MTLEAAPYTQRLDFPPKPSAFATSPKTRERLEKKLLHYIGKGIADFNLIQPHDRIMVCVSGGKDSLTLLWILKILKARAKVPFEYFAFILDQAQPGWNDIHLRSFLDNHHIPYEIVTKDTYQVVVDKVPSNQTYCSLCSRLRRGIIYRYASEHGYNKIALGHHRDDMIQTLLMSMMFNGRIRSMPPKLLSDSKEHIVIRPMCYVQEKDIKAFSDLMQFPIIPCNLCGSQPNLMRQKVKGILKEWTALNPKIPSNMLRALQQVNPSHLMDRKLWDFNQLELEQSS